MIFAKNKQKPDNHLNSEEYEKLLKKSIEYMNEQEQLKVRVDALETNMGSLRAMTTRWTKKQEENENETNINNDKLYI